jgi:hypothetical protein
MEFLQLPFSTAPANSSIYIPLTTLISELKREREREREREKVGGSERHYIWGGGKKLYLRF